mmetsp:Transcript_25825/g.58006  ORF Transcript_25825/g.58006 Transcript_25825/m.58006 type:complete len:109 (-) Transcript_25825:31-357(-)
MRQLEKSGLDGTRAKNAREVCIALQVHMDQPPASNLEKCPLMFRTTPELGPDKVLFKTLPCWCAKCLAGLWEQCPNRAITGSWSERAIRAKTYCTTSVLPGGRSRTPS